LSSTGTAPTSSDATTDVGVDVALDSGTDVTHLDVGLDTAQADVSDGNADEAMNDAPLDSGPDVVPDAPSCDPYPLCNGVCWNPGGPPSCNGCDAGNTLCNVTSPAQCASDCTGCPGGAFLGCYSCPSSSVIGLCINPSQSFTGYCLDGGYTGSSPPCPCSSGDSGSCPGGNQVCLTGIGECHSCGEGNTDGITCQNGRVCAQDAAACR
jgi:hypothetical protein